MTTPKGGVVRLQVSSQYALLLPKVPKVPFIPRIVLLFSRNAHSFPGIALLFSRSAFFLFTVRAFFQECFFSKLIVVSPRPTLSLYDSLENAVFEHLEWLKFNTFSKIFASKPPLEDLKQLRDPSAVLWTVYSKAK